MKCGPCHKNIRPGQEADKRIELWRQPDGSVVPFGVGMEAGGLDDASGVLTEARHNKCWYIGARRRQRGSDEVLGSELALAALLDDDEDLAPILG